MTEVTDDGCHSCLKGLLVVNFTLALSEVTVLLVALHLIKDIGNDSFSLVCSWDAKVLKGSVSECILWVTRPESHVHSCENLDAPSTRSCSQRGSEEQKMRRPESSRLLSYKE